ncbi:MAG: hypothetical protein K9J85_01450 [Desulfobacteraceae bacterium]|nr:hypothetical protein [Desulfobacteraceae bacterium]
MFGNARWILWGIVLAAIMLLVSGCGNEKKQANLEIEDYELFLSEDTESNLIIVNAKGTIVNRGETDVKNVEVTGYCRTCGEEIINGEWFVDDYEKMAHQKDVIGYLPAGGRSDFTFEDIAYYPAPEGIAEPEGVPEEHEFEIVIESYEISGN